MQFQFRQNLGSLQFQFLQNYYPNRGLSNQSNFDSLSTEAVY